MPEIPFSLFVAFIVTSVVYVIGIYWISKHKASLIERNIKDKYQFGLIVILGITFIAAKAIIEYLSN
jgi:hypothetical protein